MTNWPPLEVTASGMWGLRQSGQLAYLLTLSLEIIRSTRRLRGLLRTVFMSFLKSDSDVMLKSVFMFKTATVDMVHVSY